MARVLPDHDLCGAARAVGAGEEHAVLEVDLVVERLEGPDVAVRQHQHHAARIRQPVGFHRRVQMEAQRIIGLVVADPRVRRGRNRVLAVEPCAVGRSHQHAAMDQAEALDVAIMRGRQQFAVADHLAEILHAVRPGDDRRALQELLHRRHLDELAGRGLMIGQRRMRRGAARKGAPVVAAGRRHAAIDDDAARARGHLEGEAAGMGICADIRRRRRTGVDDDGHLSGVETLETGMRHACHRRAVGVVIGKQGRDQVGRRAAHAVEHRHRTVTMAKKAQHRHHAVDGVEQRRRRRDVARGKGLPQRQQVDQELDEGARIA